MKAPSFWYRQPGIASAVLTPLSWVWTIVTRNRLKTQGFDPGIPVICVGNINVGGTGKTPTVIALLEAITGTGAHVISRGYGGSLEGPIRVNEQFHKASDVGDEPLLISAFAPVWIAKDRAAAARSAIAAGAKLLIMDDGFQNPSIDKSTSIVVIDAAVGFGNGHVLPAGPLREPIDDGLARADFVVLIGNEKDRVAFLKKLKTTLPVLEAELRPLPTGMDWSDVRALAFAGIGRPEKFFTSLRDAGVEVTETRSFEDHASFRADLLKRLQAEAKSKGLHLVTTEKDAVRIPADFRRNVLVFPVRLEHVSGPEFASLAQMSKYPEKPNH